MSSLRFLSVLLLVLLLAASPPLFAQTTPEEWQARIEGEAAAYQPIFMKGFWVGLGFELFSLFLLALRQLRRGTGMES